MDYFRDVKDLNKGYNPDISQACNLNKHKDIL